MFAYPVIQRVYTQRVGRTRSETLTIYSLRKDVNNNIMQGTGCHCSDMAPTVIETLTQMPESVQVRLGVYLRRSVTVVRLQILYYAWYWYIMYIV